MGATRFEATPTVAPRRGSRTPTCERRLSARPGPCARGAFTLLFLGLLLLPAALAAAAEGDALPEGILVNRGLPPLLPDSLRDPGVVRAATERLVALGRTEAGSRRGGDALFSAAYLYRHLLGDAGAALSLYAEALAAYPAGDPMIGIVLVRTAAAELARDNPAGARVLLERALPWRTATPPRDLTEDEGVRWDQLADVLAREFPHLVALVHESEGSFAKAANVLERMLSNEALELRPERRARYFDQVARWRLRAGAREEALAANESALAWTSQPRRAADLRFWRLHARHGLVAEDGAPFLPGTWPGAAYEQDMRGFLREIQGVEGTGTSYLALGSTAFAAGRMEIALEIYLVALRAPDLLEAARQDPMIWRGLLMGFAAALDLGRLDDAQRFLEIVERIADEPHEDMAAELAAYRIALAEARAKQDTESSVTPKKKPGPQAPQTGTAGGEETEARLEPAGIRPERHRREADLDAASQPPTEDRPLWPIAVGVLGIALLLGAWLRVRRGAPSG